MEEVLERRLVEVLNDGPGGVAGPAAREDEDLPEELERADDVGDDHEEEHRAQQRQRDRQKLRQAPAPSSAAAS